MAIQLTSLFKQQDPDALRAALHLEPALANAGITYLDEGQGPVAHPLHRLCDAVFVKLLTDNQAVEMAKVLIELGANVNGNYQAEGSTPLIAAASLSCEKLGIYFVEQGADVTLLERNGNATALHWACYCGLDKLVEKLINAQADINLRDTKFKSTPVEWAVHAILGMADNVKDNQLTCILLLLKAGAKQHLFAENFKDLLNDMAMHHAELKTLLC